MKLLWINWKKASGSIKLRADCAARGRTDGVMLRGQMRVISLTEYLRKMAARENLVRMLSAEGSTFRRSDVEFLLSVQYGRQYDYHSVTQDTGSRLAYILESMTRYQQLDLSRYDGALLFLRIPAGAPLEESALTVFKQGVRARLGYADIRFGSMTREADTPEVAATLLLNKCKVD